MEETYPLATCSDCGKLRYPWDSETPYGCSNPEDPEPYDPEYYCRLCAYRLYLRYRKQFRQGHRQGDWCKSKAERRAAKEYGLVWISDGIGMLGVSHLWESGHKYITQDRYDFLKQFPYWGYCKSCGSERSGGYCGRDECVLSFRAHQMGLAGAA